LNNAKNSNKLTPKRGGRRDDEQGKRHLVVPFPKKKEDGSREAGMKHRQIIGFGLPAWGGLRISAYRREKPEGGDVSQTGAFPLNPGKAPGVEERADDKQRTCINSMIPRRSKKRWWPAKGRRGMRNRGPRVTRE